MRHGSRYRNDPIGPRVTPGSIPGVEETAIRQAIGKAYMRYGWDGVYAEVLKKHG